MGGFGLTEPDAGSDAGGTRTTAVRKGDRYVLNGTKRFITHGGVGEIFVVTAVTDPSKGTKGISSFILTKPTNDLEGARAAGVGHEPSLAGDGRLSRRQEGGQARLARVGHGELIMEDVEVPAENLLGTEGQGFINFMKTLDNGRIGIAALSLGIAEGAFEQALQVHDASASSSASRSPHFQGVQFQLVRHGDGDRGRQAPDVPRRVARAARQAVHARKRRWPSCSAPSWRCARRSRRCSSTAATATRRTIRSSGIMRDAKICEIGEGTSEIQRIVIARQLLKDLADRAGIALIARV